MKQRIAGLATTELVSSGLGLAGFGLTERFAQGRSPRNACAIESRGRSDLASCRTDKVTEEDWELAGVVMRVFNATRAEVQAT